jgi:sec-independent protein translocase protein TatA
MGFLGIGSWEILLILILTLILLGPSRLTETARTLGKIVRSIRKASADFTAAVTREMDKDQEESPPEEEKAKLPPSDTAKKEPKTKANTPPDQERRPQ